MSPVEEDGSVFRYRLDQYAGRLGKVEDWRHGVDEFRVETRGDVRDIRDAVDKLEEGISGVRRAILSFSLAIAGSSVTVSLSVLIATGKI